MADENEELRHAAADSGSRGSFAIHKVYIKDISFETPHSPGIFQEEWQPSVNMDISNEVEALDGSYYEVILTVTVTVTSSRKTVYLAEIQQAGIFHIEGFPDEIISHMTGTSCPNILFPFAREMISDLVVRGGFPQLLLAPVNFEALYMQQQQKQAGQDTDTKTSH
ncbi:MAG: protein-export chaperone SecB [Gammaproteobacteria bacterium]